MAACLISVTGTSGIIRINYTISAVDYTIETSIGSFYIDDTATGVTYTTLTGDLIASSGCLTITNEPLNCYLLFWKGITSPGYKANAIILGSTTITIPDTNFPLGGSTLITSINDANVDAVKVTGYKIVTDPVESDDPSFNEYYYILSVIGTDVPILRVRNADNTGYIYIHGESTSCTIPPGYIPIEPCYSTITTTTTLAP